jgi:1,4-dihydroxy-2-naphthoate octaprenyltransferase
MGVDDVHSPSTKYRLVTGIVPRGHVLVIGIASFAIASILGIIAVVSGNKMLLVPGLIGACISVSYSEKPLMLKYKPCGEVCVFLAYGPLLFASCILSLVGRVSAVDIVSSTPFGLMTAIILLANNIRDYGYDLGKSATLVTKLGLKRSWILLAAMAHVAYAIVIFLIYHGALPRSVAAVLVTYPLVIIALRRRRDPSMINILALLHVVFFLIITICIAL